MRSWKTTLIGLGLGVFNLVSNGVSIKTAIWSVGLTALGVFAKDHNVSGDESGQIHY